MKSIFDLKHSVFALLTCALISCGGHDDPDDITPQGPTDTSVTVAITTEILTRATAKSAFANGDEMNVWAKTYGNASAPNLVDNIKATYNGGNWSMTPAVKLDGTKVKNAFIYAIAPYAIENSAANQINVDANKQIDLLYSGSYVPVSYNTYTAKLTMKHALSLASFNIVAQGYKGTGNLQSLTLTGDSIYTKGVMTVENGKIHGTEKGDLKVNISKQITSNGWKDNLPRIWVIPLPFNTKSTKAYLKTVIDGKEYTSTIPEVEMKIGFQYIFHLVLTDNGLEFIPDQTTSISLNNEEDEMQALSGYGVLQLTHNGSGDFSSIVMNGDNVFGTVKWGDNTKSTYEDGITHTYSTGGDHALLLENWNSIGFHLRNLKGIKAIDISQYE